MHSEWRKWPDQMTQEWKTADGSTAMVVFPLLSEPWVDHDGIHAPQRFTYLEYPPEEAAPMVAVECAHTEPDLTLRITGVHIISRDPAREVRATDLRSLRLSEIVKAAAARAFKATATVRETYVDPASYAPDDTTATIAGLRTRARRSMTDALKAEVADVYLANRSHRPAQAIQDHFHVSRPTAYNYINAAIEAGYLPPRGDDHQPDEER